MKFFKWQVWLSVGMFFAYVPFWIWIYFSQAPLPPSMQGKWIEDPKKTLEFRQNESSYQALFDSSQSNQFSLIEEKYRKEVIWGLAYMDLRPRRITMEQRSIPSPLDQGFGNPFFTKLSSPHISRNWDVPTAFEGAHTLKLAENSKDCYMLKPRMNFGLPWGEGPFKICLQGDLLLVTDQKTSELRVMHRE